MVLAHGGHMGERATTSPDLNHLNNWNPNGHPRAFDESRRARNFEMSRRLRFGIVDQTQLGSRPAHIERKDLVQSAFSSDAGGQNRTACGT